MQMLINQSTSHISSINSFFLLLVRRDMFSAID
jgi:hypothetical protein